MRHKVLFFCRLTWVLLGPVLGLADDGNSIPAGDIATGKKQVTIAVVEDGASEYFTELINLVERELLILTDNEFNVRWQRSPAWSAGWNPARIRAALDNALNDPEVDIILTAGVLVAREAVRADLILSKPVINACIEDADMVGLPYNQQGRSTKKNLNFVVVPLRATRDASMFKNLFNFKTLAVLVDDVLLDNIKQISDDIAGAEKELGITIRPVRMKDSAQAVLDQLDAGVDAVYLTPGMRMPAGEWQKIIDGINQKKLPSFSMLGYQDVDRGVLAGYVPQSGPRPARRLALNLQQVMMGVPAEDLSVYMHVDETLLINARTARQIGYYLPLDVMIQATFLHAEDMKIGEPLTMVEAIVIAVKENIDLTVKKTVVETSRQSRNLAVSPLLPRIEGRGLYYQVDKDRAELSAGAQPEDRTAVGAAATQVIFNDSLISRYRAADQIYGGEIDQLQASRLDITAAAAKAYLQYLQTVTLLRIEARNLNLTRSNLMLARLRHKMGSAGPEEVFRWEAQEATDTANLINMAAAVEKARIYLNQILGEKQNKQWIPEDIELGENDYYFLGNRLKTLLSNEQDLLAFEEFIVACAARSSPMLMALDKNIQAQSIELGRAKRSFVLPELAAGFTYDRVLDEQQVGMPPPVPGSPAADDNEWMLTVQASIPLFEGAGRFYEVRSATSQLRYWRGRREQARQMLEQNARDVMQSLWSSFPNIGLQRVAADRMQQNLDIIRSKYADGSVAILSLLDAQHGAFSANQAAALAVYAYLSDLIDLQRTVSWFEFDKTEEQKDAFVEEMADFMAR